MDGVKFARDNLGLRFERQLAGTHLHGIEAQAYYNYVDHVMDNYSLREFTPSMMMPFRSVSNPDRRTTGGKVTADLAFGERINATVGVDLQENRHTLRSTMNEALRPYEAMSRAEDGRFRNAGVFGEVTAAAGASGRVITGLRVDDWYAKDSREMLSVGMGTAANPTAGEERNETLVGGFGRYERDLAAGPFTVYAGLGHVERFPDYWELIPAGKESATSLSAFHTRPEKTTQLDAGVVYGTPRASFSLSAFYSDVQDYILIQSNYPKGMRRATITRNSDADTWGGEADALYALLPSLRLTGTLAYTQGRNETDRAPLAQMPPLEARLGVDLVRGPWSAGALLRAVAEQDRYVVDQGNIVGQDIGPTPGFTVLSLNGGWHPRDGVLLTAGIDNLFDRTYAEHLSRGGAMVSGYEQTTKVNEAGRTLWLKLNLTY
jgi:iron complex outermembrane receptor protein